MLRKVNREATTRGTCVLEVIGILALTVFLLIRSTQEVLRPLAHSSGRHRGEVIRRCRRWWLFDDRKKRSSWEWQPYTGTMTDLPQQIREQIQSHRQRVDVALKRGAKRVRR